MSDIIPAPSLTVEDLPIYAAVARRMIVHSRTAAELNVRMVRYGQNRHQHIAYMPPAPYVAAKDALVCFIHGGGWKSGSGWGFRSCLPLFALRGYPCISVGYRLTPRYMYPAQSHDVIASVEAGWNDALHDELPEPRGIILVGHSAGGHLTGLLAANGHIQRALGIRLLGAAPLSGVLDFEPALRFPTDLPDLIDQFSGLRTDEADPIKNMHAELPPMLCVHGRRDAVVPVESTKNFVEEAEKRAAGRIRYVELEDGGHIDTMNMLYPDAPESALLMDFIESL